MTTPVLPEPTDETVEAHMQERHGFYEVPRAYLLLQYHNDHHVIGAPCGHTHERSHDG